MPANSSKILDSGASNGDRSTVKSLHKALSIVGSVAASERSLTVSEVALLVQVPRATAHRLIQTLVEADYLQINPVDGRVSVGLAPISIAARALDSHRLRIEALPQLQTLAKKAGERSNLGCLFQHQVLYLAGVEKPGLPSIRTRFGQMVDAHACALGKAIVAFLPEANVLALVKARPLKRVTANTITTFPSFMKDLAETRRRGYAIDRGENAEGSICISAPIFSPANVPIASIGITGRNLKSVIAEADAVLHSAELISHML
jgi:DNA-binding IclR family transcriptional regulator